MKNLNVNKKFEPFITRHKPLKILIGGRGSGKSIGVADLMCFFMYTQAQSVMCIRQYQKSIEDSVHKVIAESVEDRLNLNGWTVNKDKIIAPNGAYTTYVGAQQRPQSLKSMHGFMKSWFEEAQTASQDSLDMLIPTILRNDGAECWFTANPQSSGDPFSQRFIVPFLKEIERDGYYEDDMHMIQVVNWRDNPWWNDSAEQLRQHDYETMPRAKYDHIWEGAFNDTVDDAIIQSEWFDSAKDAHKLDRLKEAFRPNGAVIVAHDPFDDGGDAAGLAVRHGSIITQVRSKGSGQIDECCDWATGIARQVQADWFVWDGDGMGTGLKRQVSDAFTGTKTQYHLFRGSLSGSAQDNAEKIYMPSNAEVGVQKRYKDTFKNNRAQYYVQLAQRFKNTYDCVEKGKYVDPAEMISLDTDGIDDIVALKSQLCRIPSKPNANGLWQIMSKEDMKKLDIKSPNEADAIMMAMYNPPAPAQNVKLNFTGWG